MTLWWKPTKFQKLVKFNLSSKSFNKIHLLSLTIVMITLVRRHIGQMVSALDSGFRGLGSRPGRVNVLSSWARH